ncbi:hypothetical protein E5K00_15120 [Hymenobacter aquaticus]|uniref:Uncharacterized protein n=1 Tax=Hymenobacter aquaticus TaxID=1867101 RepID=A0A4Z0PV44_9BACT|nr:hypothetical protein [Hymenobacter aquaticus]TGE21608.1 hypothetical protein E5K00_15120 [Hymenobacter aquaticus]
MAKTKGSGKGKGNKKAQKARQSAGWLDEAAGTLHAFRKATKSVRRLTTGQKVVGGLALLAAGLTYLAKRQAAAAAAVTPDARAAEAHLATLSEPPAPAEVPAGRAPARRKSRKRE